MIARSFRPRLETLEGRDVPSSNPIEGHLWSGRVASFNIDRYANPSELTAIINWGDGHIEVSSDIRQQSGSTNYSVYGSHLWQKWGFYDVDERVSLIDNGTGYEHVETADWHIEKAAITIQPIDIYVQAGKTYHGPVARVLYDNPYATAADLSPLIDWYDAPRTVRNTGELRQEGPGTFVLYGTHTFAPLNAGTTSLRRAIGLQVNYTTETLYDRGPTAVGNAYVSQPLPDLIGTSFSYSVPGEKRTPSGEIIPVVNGPVPVNLAISGTYTVRNQGGTAGRFTVGFYMSKTSTINPATSLLLGSARIAGLAGEQSLTQKINLKLPTNLSTIWSGTVYFGMVVDSVNEVRESNEANNRTSRAVRLFDPILPRTTLMMRNAQGKIVERAFTTKAAAEAYLRGQKFSDFAIALGPFATDRGWSRATTTKQFSRATGQWMNPGAYRIHAGPYEVSKGRWVIKYQGSNQAGEPSPRNLFDWGFNADYVREYHTTF